MKWNQVHLFSSVEGGKGKKSCHVSGRLEAGGCSVGAWQDEWCRMLHSFDFHLVASLNTHGTGQKMFGPLFEASQGYKRHVSCGCGATAAFFMAPSRRELSMAAKAATLCLMDGQFERCEMWLRPWEDWSCSSIKLKEEWQLKCAK